MSNPFEGVSWSHPFGNSALGQGLNQLQVNIGQGIADSPKFLEFLEIGLVIGAGVPPWEVDIEIARYGQINPANLINLGAQFFDPLNSWWNMENTQRNDWWNWGNTQRNDWWNATNYTRNLWWNDPDHRAGSIFFAAVAIGAIADLLTPSTSSAAAAAAD